MTPKLNMRFAGAEWLRKQFSYEKKTLEISPFGETVAEALGFAWRGIYHLSYQTLRRAKSWDDDRWIRVPIGNGRGELATWDSDELMRLVVVSYDLGMRLSVEQHGFGLALGFGRRQGPYVFGRRDGDGWVPAQGSIMSHLPTLLGHIHQLRGEYDVVEPEPELADPREIPVLTEGT